MARPGQVERSLKGPRDLPWGTTGTFEPRPSVPPQSLKLTKRIGGWCQSLQLVGGAVSSQPASLLVVSCGH